MRLDELRRGGCLVHLRGGAMPFGGILMCVAVRIVGVQRGLFVRGSRAMVDMLGVPVVLGGRTMGGEGALQ